MYYLLQSALESLKWVEMGFCVWVAGVDVTGGGIEG